MGVPLQLSPHATLTSLIGHSIAGIICRMADAAPVSKSAKRNQKRRERKKAEHPAPPTSQKKPSLVHEVLKKESPPPLPVILDPIAELKRLIEEAKAAKDHERTQELRQQLWVLQDTAVLGKAGPGAPQLDASVFTPPLKQQHEIEVVPGRDNPVEKQLAKLRKKLQQIQGLKRKHANGEKLEENQLAKIKTETDILDEIDILVEQNQLR